MFPFPGHFSNKVVPNGAPGYFKMHFSARQSSILLYDHLSGQASSFSCLPTAPSDFAYRQQEIAVITMASVLFFHFRTGHDGHKFPQRTLQLGPGNSFVEKNQRLIIVQAQNT